jgi:hypothetical protein
MAMFRGEHYRPAWRLNQIGIETVGEDYPLLCNAVEFWFFYKPTIIGAQGLIRMVIGHYKDNIGTREFFQTFGSSNRTDSG